MNKGPAILLFRGRGLISTLIRWQTRGKYSHAAFLLPDGSIIEAREGYGVHEIPPGGLADWKGVDIYDVPDVTPEQWEKAFAGARAELGKGYDWWAIVRFVSRRHMPKNDKWFCSELIFEKLLDAGFALLSQVEASAVDPWRLVNSPYLKLRK